MMTNDMSPGHARVSGGRRNSRFRALFQFGFLVLLMILVLTPGFVAGDVAAASDGETAASASASSSGEDAPAAGGSKVEGEPKKETSEGEETTTTKKQKKPPTPGSDEDEGWGSFYDPNNIFCGKFDCYKILGFDYESWGRAPPTLREITKSYRSLSRQWHPDKNKAKGAREKFVKIAKAYEILTNVEKRAEYDHFRDRPDEYFQKYGSSVLWSYAPQSDARYIVVLFLLLGSAFTYFAQKKKWQTIADHLVKTAVEETSTREGGSNESADMRAKAMAILEKQREEEERLKEAAGNGTAVKKQKGPKLSAREKREKEQELLRPICVKLASEIDDFGGGFRKPSVHDLLIVQLVKLPFNVTKSVAWWTKYAVRRLKKSDLNEEEREVLTKNAVGAIGWAAASEEDRVEMVTLDLWEAENLIEWREKQEMKGQKLSANRKKKVDRMNKRGGGSKMD